MKSLFLTLFLLQSIQSALTEYVTDWMQTIRQCRSYDKRLSDAKSYIPIVIKYSEQYNIDPFQAAIIISYESSWKMNAIGAKKDTGLMQVMPQYFKQFDLKTADGQIHAGISHLRKALDACNNDLTQAYTYYKYGGRCKPIDRAMQWRANKYRKIRRRYWRWIEKKL